MEHSSLLQICPHQLDLLFWRTFTCFFLTGAELTLPNLCLQGFSQPDKKLTTAWITAFSVFFLEGFPTLPPLSQDREADLQLLLVLPEVVLNNSIASAKSACCSSLFQITWVCWTPHIPAGPGESSAQHFPPLTQLNAFLQERACPSQSWFCWRASCKFKAFVEVSNTLTQRALANQELRLPYKSTTQTLLCLTTCYLLIWLLASCSLTSTETSFTGICTLLFPGPSEDNVPCWDIGHAPLRYKGQFKQ